MNELIHILPRLNADPDRFLDDLEALIAKLALDYPPKLELEHIFTPGLYCRKIFMPKGSIGTSKIHKTEHPFVVLSGEVTVWTKREGMVHYSAPYIGITLPETRRLLYINEDTTWMTFHPTTKTSVPEIEDEITYIRPSTLLLTI